MTVGEYIDELYRLIDELEVYDESAELTMITDTEGAITFLVGDSEVQDYKQSLS